MSHERPSAPEQSGIVEKVSSAAELLPTIQRGAKAAVFEAPFTGIEAGNELIFESNLVDYLKLTFNGVASVPEKRIKENRALFAQRIASKNNDSQFQSLLTTYDTITRDVISMLRHLPGFYISSCDLSYGNNVHAGDQEWHLDNEDITYGTKHLRFIRVYRGESTEYAEDAHGANRQTCADGSVMVHEVGSRGAWHRTPLEVDSNRFVFRAWLKPL